MSQLSLRSFLLPIVFACIVPCAAQVLPATRATDWSKAGLHPVPEGPAQVIDITTFGGSGDGVTPNDAALSAAFASVHGQRAVVFFPPGDHLFTSTIFLPDSVVLRGAGAGVTTLTFSLGGVGHCIAAIGAEDTLKHVLTQAATRGGTQLWTASTTDLSAGDEVRLYRNDSALVVSPWAIGTAGQLANVTAVQENGITIAAPLRASYPLAATSYFRRMRPVRNAGIECLRIVRTDAAPPDEWSNIHLDRAAQCWVRGVESDHCNFAHVELFASTNCEVSGCYFHHAFAYGGNGQGYGVMAYYTSGEDLIYDNVFQHLRHAMIVQAGANGNVFAYNRSVDGYWDEGAFPTNAAGDIVLHGDHPYLNLFEGNILQNIVIDDSHGANGPFNTLFRNRTTLWGLVMSASPATDSVNFVGNDISGSPGLHVVTGTGHFEYGDNVLGTATPSGSEDLTDLSYYAAQEPAFLAVQGGWPQIGYHSVFPFSIPAATRYTLSDDITVCSEPIMGITEEAADAGVVNCRPVPFDDRFTVTTAMSGPLHLTLRNTLGACVLQRDPVGGSTSFEVTGCSSLPSGVYVLELTDARGRRSGLPVLKQ